jgi:hypothetical protein
MSTSIKNKSWQPISLLAVLFFLAVFYWHQPSPCQFPVTYRIGTVDGRFGLTHQEFRVAVHRAAALWGEPLSRALFQEDPQGAIEVNLVYDYRQETTDQLKKLNYTLDGSKSSHDELNNRLAGLKKEYEDKNTALSKDSSTYQGRINAFNTEVETWNRRGGVPENIHRRLNQEKEELDRLRDILQGRQEELKNLAYTINNLVVVINEIATNHNLNLFERQNTGNSLGREFCEGLYETKDGRQTITIYQFDSEARLERVLAHEFGHALGLPHSPAEEAVMYRLVKSLPLKLSPEDRAALKKQCKIRDRD